MPRRAVEMTSGVVPPLQNQIRRILAPPKNRLFQQLQPESDIRRFDNNRPFGTLQCRWWESSTTSDSDIRDRQNNIANWHTAVPVARAVDIREDRDPGVSRTAQARDIPAEPRGSLIFRGYLLYTFDTYCIRLVLLG